MNEPIETPIKMRMVRPGRVFLIYKTENISTGEFYIGCHCQRGCEFDGYYGSGKAFKKNLKKYGKDSFIREILYSYFTREEAALKELELVNETTLTDPLMMNIRPGGVGIASLETRQKMSEWERTPETRQKMSEWQIGKKKSPEHCANNGKAKRKIADEQIQEIMRMREKGMSQKDMAKKYDVSQATIGSYLRKEQKKQKE